MRSAGGAGKPLPLYGKEHGVCRSRFDFILRKWGWGGLDPVPPYGKLMTSVQVISA